MAEHVDELIERDTTPPALKADLAEISSPAPEVVAEEPEPAPDPAPEPDVAAPAEPVVVTPDEPVATLSAARLPQQAPGVTPDEVSELRRENEVLKKSQSVLQGKYNTERPRLEQEKLERDVEIERLKATNADLQHLVDSRPVDVGSMSDADFQGEYGITDEQLDEHGRNFWEGLVQVNAHAIRRTQSAQAEKIQRSMDEGMSELHDKQDVQGRIVQEQTDERYLKELDRLVPDWEALKSTPEWTAWLDGTPFYDDALKDADETNDAQRTSDLIGLFLSLHPDVDLGASGEPAVSIDSQVNPRRAAAPLAETPATSRRSAADELSEVSDTLTKQRGSLSPKRLAELEQRSTELQAILTG